MQKNLHKWKKCSNFADFLDSGSMRKRQKVLLTVNAAIVALMGLLGVSCETPIDKYAPMYIANDHPTVTEKKADVPEAGDKVLDIKVEEETR